MGTRRLGGTLPQGFGDFSKHGINTKQETLNRSINCWMFARIPYLKFRKTDLTTY